MAASTTSKIRSTRLPRPIPAATQRLRPIRLAYLWLLLVACASPSPPAPDQRFGVIESYESPNDATELGASWTRVRFHWGTIQPSDPSEWHDPVPIETLEQEVASGREIVGLIIGIPDWARDPRLLPQGLYLAPDDPDNTVALFIRSLVTRYKGMINHWIVWNEPDIWDKETPGHTWDGDERDFAQLQRTAYHVIKDASPGAFVHLAALTYYWDANFGREQYLGRLLDAINADPEAAANHHYFDIATAHLYFQPDAIFQILTEFQNIMSSKGLQKPIWLVETNAPPADDPSWPVESITLNVTQHDQAIFQSQALSAALAAGADRIALYKLRDLPSDRAANPEPFGLVRQDGSKRPAFAAAQTAFRYMAGVQHAAREQWDGHAQIRLEQKDRITHVLFSRLGFPQTASIPANAPKAQLVDMWGNSTTLLPEDGYYTIELPKSDCSQPIADYCMIGGETYYLVQPTTGQE